MNILKQQIWNQVLDGFAKRHGNGLLDLWFKHTRPLSFSKGLFVLGVPNLFVREWLEKKYIKDVEELFLEITGSPVKVTVKIDGYLFRFMNEMETEARQTRRKQEKAAARVETGDGRFTVRPECKVAASAFDKVVRDAPACTFNPLFFYGPAGIGKTHLVGQFLARAKRTGFYTEAQSIDALQFAREFNAAARVGNRVRFRGKVLRTDLLVLEEVHRLKGKIKTQLELLSILKYLVDRQRQVVITSRHHPRDIDLFEDSLASFMLSGMVVSILGYGAPSLVEILQQKAKEADMSVPPTLIEAVSQISALSIGEQMQLIKRVVSLASMKNEAPTAGFLREHFPEYETGEIGEDRVDRIIDLVARYTGVDRDQIASSSKVRRVVEARYLVIYLASTLLKTSSRKLCRWLGNVALGQQIPYPR